MIFAKRYSDLIYYNEDGELKDEICGEMDYVIRQRLVSIMQEFSQPMVVHCDRYNMNETEETDALIESCKKFNEIMQIHYINYDPFGLVNPSYNLAAQCPAFIFSVIELQYENLKGNYILDRSEKNNLYSGQKEYQPVVSNEKVEFSSRLNSFFTECDIPWRILDGKMIKIDALQFECDLRAKALAEMQELKDAEPKFQSSYTELTSAIEAFEKKDYQSAINNAEKSYESILKVILNADRGNADKLTTQYQEQFLTVPDTMTKPGFREKVMLSLPYVRNNSGADHGAGAKEVVISKPMAKLAINLAAALDTYLIEEYLNNNQSKGE